MSIHSMGSGTKLLDEDCFLSYSRAPTGDMSQVDLGMLTHPTLSVLQLEFFQVDTKVACLMFQILI